MQNSFIFYLMIISIFLALIFVILGIIGLSRSLYVLIRMKREKELRTTPSKKRLKTVLFFIASVFIFSISLYWFANYTSFGDDYPTLGLAALDAGFKNLQEVDTNINSVPVILAEGRNNSLYVFTYVTQKTPFFMTKYFINGEVPLIADPSLPPLLLPPFLGIPNPVPTDTEPAVEIDESRVWDIPERFPDIWFGFIYARDRDRIRINGEIPDYFDIHFNGTDYVFWYIEKNGEEVKVSFE